MKYTATYLCANPNLTSEMILSKQPFLLSAFLLAAACSSSSQNQPVATADTLAPLPAHLCFLQTTGKDSSHIEIYFSGAEFSGIYDWIPFEKDARRGTVQGTLKPKGKNRLLKGTWTYMQEGMKQELPFEALVSEQTLQQRDYDVDSQTRNQVLSADETYPLAYQAVPCGNP